MNVCWLSLPTSLIRGRITEARMSDKIADLVQRLRTMAPRWNDNRNLLEAADALEQQARELAACEGALRNSGNMVRDLNDLAKRYENELTRRGIPLPGEPTRRGGTRMTQTLTDALEAIAAMENKCLLGPALGHDYEEVYRTASNHAFKDAASVAKAALAAHEADTRGTQD
jgi:hypothetical protein